MTEGLCAFILALAVMLQASPLCAQSSRQAASASPSAKRPAVKKPPARKPAARKPAAQAGGSVVIIKSGAQQANAAPTPAFNERADAMRDIGEAMARSKRTNRRVLILWGNKDSEACARLCSLFVNDPPIAKQMRAEFDLVLVDVGRLTRNLELATSYGATISGSGVPYLTLLDGDGMALSNQASFALLDNTGGFDRSRVLELLRIWQPRYPAAERIVADAVEAAQSRNRLVFLRFVSPAAEASRELDEWLALPDTRSIMERDFVDARVDVDRTVGGKDLMRHYCGNPPPALPWFALVNPESGEVLATSATDAGALGFPRTEEAIARFERMLEQVCRNMGGLERTRLSESLRQWRSAPPREQVPKTPPQVAR